MQLFFFLLLGSLQTASLDPSLTAPLIFQGSVRDMGRSNLPSIPSDDTTFTVQVESVVYPDDPWIRAQLVHQVVTMKKARNLVSKAARESRLVFYASSLVFGESIALLDLGESAPAAEQIVPSVISKITGLIVPQRSPLAALSFQQAAHRRNYDDMVYARRLPSSFRPFAGIIKAVRRARPEELPPTTSNISEHATGWNVAIVQLDEAATRLGASIEKKGTNEFLSEFRAFHKSAKAYFTAFAGPAWKNNRISPQNNGWDPVAADARLKIRELYGALPSRLPRIVTLFFPTSNDIAWSSVKKFTKQDVGQRGLFILTPITDEEQAQELGLKLGSITAFGPRDFTPISSSRYSSLGLQLLRTMRTQFQQRLLEQ